MSDFCWGFSRVIERRIFHVFSGRAEWMGDVSQSVKKLPVAGWCQLVHFIVVGKRTLPNRAPLPFLPRVGGMSHGDQAREKY